ncbi:MAG: DMT family transporter [Clostridia bacterium]|nr:DMT family transporter [Clostridia bacterium]
MKLKKEYFLASVSILCWSTVSVISKLLLNQFTSMQILWISSFFAFLFLLLYHLVTGRIRKLKEYRFKDFAKMASIGCLGTFWYYVFYYAGTDRMLASQAFIVNYLWPIMSIVFTCLVLKRRMTPKKIFALILSFAGVAVVVCGDLTSSNQGVLLGSFCCFLGAVSYGLYTALSQKYSYDRALLLMLSYFATFSLTSIWNFARGELFLPKLLPSIGMAWNGIFTMALANITWTAALNAGKPEKISNLAYITPVMSLVWTSIVLREPFRLSNIIGFLIIILGIFIQLKDSPKQKK